MDERESYWIAFYDSYSNGYNMTLGGQGYKKYNLDEVNIVDTYKNGTSINMIAKSIGVSTYVISAILEKHDIDIITRVDNTEIGLIQLDQKLAVVNAFESKSEAYKWMVQNYKDDLKKSTFYYCTKRAYETHGIALGFYWILADNNFDTELYKIKAKMNERFNKRVSNPSVEELIEAYNKAGGSKEATGKYFSVTGTTIGKWINQVNNGTYTCY